MKSFNKKIKVCGMRDAKNISALAQLPIDYIGFIFYPRSARYVTENPTTPIPSSIQKVGVFVNASVEEIRTKIDEFGLDVIQLHGDESPAFCREISELGLVTFKAFGIGDDFHWDTLAAYEGEVDYYLFDTKSKDYGGTGQTFDWDKLKNYPFQTPYWLSGGLSIENIQEAANVDDPRLFGLDLNSKFETAPGLKDIEKIKKALKYIQ